MREDLARASSVEGDPAAREVPPYAGTLPRRSAELVRWHARSVSSVALDPGWPIVDAHHHLFGTLDDTLHYTLDELTRDLAGGHRILGTVYCEAYESGWRTTGPAHLKPVGEVERIVALTPAALELPHGSCEVAAAIVAHCDMTRPNELAELVDAEAAAAAGRLRGVRHRTATDDGIVGQFIPQRPEVGLMRRDEFRDSVRRLAARELSFDAWLYHHQLGEFIELADACPDTRLVLNHVGGLIGVAEYRSSSREQRSRWLADLRELARRPNVVLKVGGLGMAVFGFGFEHGDRPADARELDTAWRPLIHACLDAFGTARCMFESNFPVDKQSCNYIELWNALKRASRELSVDERSDLFYRTTCRAYRLPELERRGDTLVRQLHPH